MKKYIIFMAVIGGLFIISSCSKFQVSNEAIADVFIRSLNYNGQTAYSAVFSMTATSAVSEVMVDTPYGTSFKLTPLTSDGLNFLTDTSFQGAGYSHQPIGPGVFTFHVNYVSAKNQTYTNTLSSESLLPPVIDSLYKKPDGVNLRIKWEPVAGADAYEMRITSGSNEIMPWLEYGSTQASQLYYERPIAMFSYYLPGTITFEIRAVKYESNRNYVQAIGYNKISIDL